MIRCRFIAGCLDVFIVNLAAPTMYAQAIMVKLLFDTSDIFLNAGRMMTGCFARCSRRMKAILLKPYSTPSGNIVHSIVLQQGFCPLKCLTKET